MPRSPDEVRKVAVVGGGVMGRGCAQVFAASGYRVALLGRAQERLLKSVDLMRRDLTSLAERGVGGAGDVEDTVSRISLTVCQEEALEGADFVLECVSEDMSLKQELFARLDRAAGPDAILASNTSVMSITEIAGRCAGKHRILGTHWWNPPYLIPLVEVVRTAEVADEAVESTMALLAAVGKHPIECKKDVPGFVANRLQHALWREAISIVERGIADAATVDEALKYGPGLRLPVLAPLENSDMVGAEVTLAIHSYVLQHLEDSHEPSPLLRKMVEKNELGFKTGRGFYDWTPEAIETLRQRLIDYLVKATAGDQ